jgi:hypothetical protein
MAEVQSRMNVATSERDLLLKQQQDAKGELVQLSFGAAVIAQGRLLPVLR